MFSVRAVTVDSYLSKPIDEWNGDEKENPVREWLEPVIRIFGATVDGKKCCVHVHGVYPYLYVPCKGGDNPKRDALLLGAALDEALKTSFKSKVFRYVHQVIQVSALPLYGYHSKHRKFFKIYFFNPFHIGKASELLLSGAILGQKFQPHEAHIPYTLQFMMDYNIYGMSFVTFSKVMYRRNPDRPDSTNSISPKDIWSDKVKKTTHSHLEVDAQASDIVNRMGPKAAGTNPGLRAIWEDERELRRRQNRPSPITAPQSQTRSESHTYPAELMHREQLLQKLRLVSAQDPTTCSHEESTHVYPAEVLEDEDILEASAVDEGLLRPADREVIFDVSTLLDEEILSQVAGLSKSEENKDDSVPGRIQKAEEEAESEEEDEEEEEEEGVDMTQPLESEESEDEEGGGEEREWRDEARRESGRSNDDAFWRSIADKILQLDGAQESSSESDGERALPASASKERTPDGSPLPPSSWSHNIMSILSEDSGCRTPSTVCQTPRTFWSNYSPNWLQDDWTWTRNGDPFPDLAADLPSPDPYLDLFSSDFSSSACGPSPVATGVTPVTNVTAVCPIAETSAAEDRPQGHDRQKFLQVLKSFSGRKISEDHCCHLTLKQYIKNCKEIVSVDFKNLCNQEMIIIEYKSGNKSHSNKYLIKPLEKFLENWTSAERRANVGATKVARGGEAEEGRNVRSVIVESQYGEGSRVQSVSNSLTVKSMELLPENGDTDGNVISEGHIKMKLIKSRRENHERNLMEERLKSGKRSRTTAKGSKKQNRKKEKKERRTEWKTFSELDSKLINEINSSFEEYFKTLVKRKKLLNGSNENETQESDEGADDDKEEERESSDEDEPIGKNADPIKFVTQFLSTFSRMSEVPPFSVTINLGNPSVQVNIQQPTTLVRKEVMYYSKKKRRKMKVGNVDGPADESSSESEEREERVKETKQEEKKRGKKRRKREPYYKPLKVMVYGSPCAEETSGRKRKVVKDMEVPGGQGRTRRFSSSDSVGVSREGKKSSSLRRREKGKSEGDSVAKSLPNVITQSSKKVSSETKAEPDFIADSDEERQRRSRIWSNVRTRSVLKRIPQADTEAFTSSDEDGRKRTLQESSCKKSQLLVELVKVKESFGPQGKASEGCASKKKAVATASKKRAQGLLSKGIVSVGESGKKTKNDSVHRKKSGDTQRKTTDSSGSQQTGTYCTQIKESENGSIKRGNLTSSAAYWEECQSVSTQRKECGASNLGESETVGTQRNRSAYFVEVENACSEFKEVLEAPTSTDYQTPKPLVFETLDKMPDLPGHSQSNLFFSPLLTPTTFQDVVSSVPEPPNTLSLHNDSPSPFTLSGQPLFLASGTNSSESAPTPTFRPTSTASEEQISETMLIRGAITICPEKKPLTRKEAVESIGHYDILENDDAAPFYSDYRDLTKALEAGPRVLKIRNHSLSGLKTFKSSLNVKGTEERREMLLGESRAERWRLVGEKELTMEPLQTPPSLTEVLEWLSRKEEQDRPTPRKFEKAKVKILQPPRSEQEEESDEETKLSASASNVSENVSTLCSSELSGKKSALEEDESKLKKELRGRQFHGGRESEAMRGAEEPRFPQSSGEEKEKGSCENSFQIRGVTLDNTFGFTNSVENIKNVKKSTAYQHMDMLVVEVHVQTRGNLRPDPDFDPIRALFYSIVLDGPLREQRTGVIVVGDGGGNGNSLPARSLPRDLSVRRVPTERDLMDNLLSLVRDWDPEILAGYETEMHSWGYIVQRGAVLEMNLTLLLGRVIADDFPKKKTDDVDNDCDDIPRGVKNMRVSGRIVLDIWRVLRREVALTSYSFENVMYHLAHERHPLLSHEKLSFYWEHPTEAFRHIVIDHYVTRVVGVTRILDQLDFIGRTGELARLFGIQFYEVLSRGSQFRVESMMLRLAKPLNYIAVSPSVAQRAAMRAPASLPLILEPESLFYADPIIVLDFQSLYPSMIIAYNYCFSTCLGRVEKLGGREAFDFGCTQLQISPEELKSLEKDISISPAGVVFVKANVRRGVLPTMLEEILETRLMVKKSMKENKKDKILQKVLFSRQLGLKLIANVTYGYTAANFSGRMPCIEVGDSVVSKGRETLHRAIQLVKNTRKWGAKVVYGDTDSIFVCTPGRTREEAFKIGAEIAEAVTWDNPQPVKLKLEKVYQPCILQTKKRYLGYMYESPEQEKPVFEAKGIETVRRDGCPATGKILEKALRILFDTRDVSLVKKYAIRQFGKLFQGRVNLQDLIFAKEYRGRHGYRPGACVPALHLAKQWTQYDKRAEPRVKERVPYVIVNGPPGVPLIKLVRSPDDLLSDPSLRINAVYYITKAIVPPMQRCFSLLGADVMSWYTSMPRKLQKSYKWSISEGRKRSTISQYFAAKECVACCRVTGGFLCPRCEGDPQRTVLCLCEKVRRWERCHEGTLEICRSCCGRLTEIDCISLDCPVLFRRMQAKRALEQEHAMRQFLTRYF